MSEIITLLSKVMDDAGAVHKNERNNHQQFNFRGIDAVVNAVSPALRKHGVVVIPTINSCDYETVEVGQNRSRMASVRVNVTYTFHAPDGSNVGATVSAESMDSGDKATAKAMSVAFRTALLQTLCLPTDDIDPDATTYERSSGAKTETPQRLTNRPAPTPVDDAPIATTPARKRVEVGSAAKKTVNATAHGKITENQIKFMHTVSEQINADDSLLKDLANGMSLKDLSSADASAIIDKLLAVKRGNATMVFDEHGKADILKDEESE
jgi:hypothetical protein